MTSVPAGEPAPLRVWLEPGYDGGRVGAWLLDMPGAFGWARSRALARSQSLSVAGRFREWAGEHGEPVALPPLRGVEVVEEVPAARRPDGSERNATFGRDHRAVPAEELETTIRRAAHARDDFCVILGRVQQHELRRGPLPTDGERQERTGDALARHVGSAEIWLASRLDSSVRYDGPPQDGDRDAFLAATRSYALERLRALHALDPALERTDGKGETWTMAKVLRRVLYHSLDHLWELDRRLARVDGSAGAVRVVLDRVPPIDQVIALLRAVGWDNRADDPDRVERAITGSREVATAWAGERLVGMARSVSDGAINAYLAMVIVHPRWQALGVGRRVVTALMEGHEDLRFSLSAADGLTDWYERLGFELDPRAMVRRVRRS